MSMAALLLATRNLLRANLTGFYDDPSTTKQERMRAANCRVMPNHYPTASSGQEFIALYGASHRRIGGRFMTAIEEEYEITIAVSRRIPLIPRDARGELGYIFDEATYDKHFIDLGNRTREIIGLIDQNYDLIRAAEVLLEADADYGYIQPLIWTGADAHPEEVGAEHFCAYHTAVDSDSTLPGIPEADDVYGLLTHIQFGEANRLQPNAVYDTTAS